jgi:hypothetical protein
MKIVAVSDAQLAFFNYFVSIFHFEFQFINSYLFLFYIAFYLQDEDLLQSVSFIFS